VAAGKAGSMFGLQRLVDYVRMVSISGSLWCDLNANGTAVV
jgi:hypothetical protein